MSSSIQHAAEFRSFAHPLPDPGEPRGVAADVDAQGVSPVGLSSEVAREDHPGAEVDRPAVEGAQPLGADLDVPDELRVLGERLLGEGSRQLEGDRPARGRVDSHLADLAVEVAGRVGEIQVAVGVQEGLDGVDSRAKLAEARDREDRTAIVEDRRSPRGEAGHVAPQDRRGVHAGPADREPGLTAVGRPEHDQQPAGAGLPAREIRRDRDLDPEGRRPGRAGAGRTERQRENEQEREQALWRMNAGHPGVLESASRVAAARATPVSYVPARGGGRGYAPAAAFPGFTDPDSPIGHPLPEGEGIRRRSSDQGQSSVPTREPGR